MTGLHWSGPFDEPDDEEEMQVAREEMEDLLDEARGNPFVALDNSIEDNPAFDEYEDEVKDARSNAFAMMDDIDLWDAEDAGEGDSFDDWL